MAKFIREFSDLHNEFFPFEIPKMDEDNETILVLAGDIDLATNTRIVDFLKKAAEQFQDVVYVFGNHEYYNTNFVTPKRKLYEELVTNQGIMNVHILEKESIKIGDVVFIGATLWTDFDKFNPITMFDANRVMNDYKQIRNGPVGEPWKWKLQPHEVATRHYESKNFIFDECKKQKNLGCKVVVVTHHSPSFESVTEGFKGNPFNGLYHSQLDELVLDAEPDVWFHGHIHQTISYDIGNTKVFTNPRGYCPHDLNPLFNPYFRISL